LGGSGPHTVFVYEDRACACIREAQERELGVKDEEPGTKMQADLGIDGGFEGQESAWGIKEVDCH
jgi:hypothetical protein